MLNKFRESLRGGISNIARIFVKIGFKPWTISLLGLILVITASLWMATNPTKINILIAILLYLLGNAMDALDGEVARLTGSVSKWGGYLDSILDRIGEIIFILSISYTNILTWDLTYIYIVTAILISYSRARGEVEGVKLSGVGIMERAERVIAIALILILYITIGIDPAPLFIILIILNIATVIHRSIYIYKTLRKS